MTASCAKTRSNDIQRLFAVTLLTITAITGSARAVDIPIANNSFEDPNVGGGFAIGVPTGWTGVGAGNAFIEDAAAVGMTGQDGAQYLGLDNDGSYIYQDLGIAFEAQKVYRVDLAGAHRDTFTHGFAEFGVFSSNAIGTDLGTAGFMDIQGVWSGSGNPDGDDMFDLFRDASVLNGIGTGALGKTSRYATGNTVPGGNVVVFIRQNGGGRINVDDIRLDVSDKQAGDVDGNDIVDLVDFNLIRSNFRKSVAPNLGDLNEDGIVDFTDFREWKDNYPFPLSGLNLSLNSVPEPSSAMLCSFVLGTLMCGRRTRLG